MHCEQLLFDTFERLTFDDPVNRTGVMPDQGIHYCPLVTSTKDGLWARFWIGKAAENVFGFPADLQIYTPDPDRCPEDDLLFAHFFFIVNEDDRVVAYFGDKITDQRLGVFNKVFILIKQLGSGLPCQDLRPS